MAASEFLPASRAPPKSEAEIRRDARMQAKAGKLRLRLLGELEVLRGDARIELPPSRKSRALLAYLVVTARPQRRDRLCSIFWEVPDDPRGSLRWSLSRLRAIVDDKAAIRIIADRDTVAFDAARCDVDLLNLRALDFGQLGEIETARLVEAADSFRGEFLEGLDLPNSHDFQSWCVAEREELHRLHARILTELRLRHESDAEAALSYVRRLVHADPFNEEARMDFLRLLAVTGRRQEAESQFEAAERLFRELSDVSADRLRRNWRTILKDCEKQAAATTASAIEWAAPAQPRKPGVLPFVGRNASLRQMIDTLNQAANTGGAKVVTLFGEPGIGKSRLIVELANYGRSRAIRVLAGRCYDSRLGAAYAPWVEALGELPATDTERDAALGRQRLFAAMAAKVSGEERGPALLIFEDIQWMDEASAELLRYVMRACQDAPLTVVLAAREGELPDNPAVESLLRNLYREHVVEHVRLAPLSAEDIELLVRTTGRENDVSHIVSMSGGNPLYALELARSLTERPELLPHSLKELVRERQERLPAAAADVLRWASVLGPEPDAALLQKLVGFEPEDFVSALEILERREMLAPGGSRNYSFSHELVRQAIYTGLSEPRRRLMHLKIAKLMQDGSFGPFDIAYHASAGGDAGMAAKACIEAARNALRFFAHADALQLARRGQHYLETLADPVRSERLIEIAEIELRARPLHDIEAFSARLEQLAGTALDFGRPDYAWRCYKMLADIRWEKGAWSDARHDTLHAELLSRTANDAERVTALAEAARCLAMLERDLDMAEALVLEAHDLGRRAQTNSNAIADANGLLAFYKGQFDEARQQFRHARLLARQQGDRLSEFLALEHLAMMEIENESFDDAFELCDEISDLAGRIRPGSEQPFAAALHELCRYARSPAVGLDAFERVLQALRVADSKHRLSFTAATAAHLLLKQGDVEQARRLAQEALEASSALNRPSSQARALSILIETADGNDQDRQCWIDQLNGLAAGGLGKWALARARGVLASQIAEERSDGPRPL